MLEIKVDGAEYFDPEKQEFIRSKGCTLQLEHSLISIAKWESKWEKPFLSKGEKTIEETIDYVRCMTLNSGVDSDVYLHLRNDDITAIKNYIEADMTATTFHNNGPQGSSGPRNNEQITSELIYYWMVANQIPFECQKWHLNRLLTLIKICGIKNSPSKKMSKSQTASSYAALNAARRKAHHTSG